MSTTYEITNEEHLTKLDTQLKDNLYIGGQHPSADDATVYEQYANQKSEPNQDKHLNLWSWYALMSIYAPQVRNSWKSAPAQQQKGGKQDNRPKKETKTEEKTEEKNVDDEVDDLFGAPTDTSALDKLKKGKEDEKKDKKKPAVIFKSLVILEVKVWDPEQDYDALAAKILKIEKDGLFWKTQYQLQDVAFGVKKIVIGMVVEDEKISVDDIIDEIQSWEDDVQSVDIKSFEKC
jgi:elongation factor 1-beta